MKRNGLDFVTLQPNTIDCYVPGQIRFRSTYRFSEQNSVQQLTTTFASMMAIAT